MTETSETMSSRELFHAACAGIKTERPPFWMMRQAGRYLPEYRALKEKYGFLGIVKTPEVGVEAALQPIRRFDFDCAILFSDILVISEALGFPYKFKDGGGIMLERRARSLKDIENMPEAPCVRENLKYVRDNLRILREELAQKAIFGFCGSPFTIAAYMIEGESSKDFPVFRKFITENTGEFEALMGNLTAALCEYAKMQVECGIDAFQIFDSHGAIAPDGQYAQYSGEWISEIIKAVDGRARTSVFASKMTGRFDELSTLGADIYSLDSAVPLSGIFKMFDGSFALQGNLDPSMLSDASPRQVAQKTTEIISDMFPYGRHIFNLGHGILPDAKIENVEAMCGAVKNYGADI